MRYLASRLDRLCDILACCVLAVVEPCPELPLSPAQRRAAAKVRYCQTWGYGRVVSYTSAESATVNLASL